jgi:hypothetical protein
MNWRAICRSPSSVPKALAVASSRVNAYQSSHSARSVAFEEPARATPIS